MPQFGRHTKTRTSSFGTSIPTVEFFAAHMAPGCKIEWSAEDGKRYSLCLYGDEIPVLIDKLTKTEKLREYSSLELCVRSAARMFMMFKDFEMTVDNLDGDGHKYRLKFEKVDPLI